MEEQEHYCKDTGNFPNNKFFKEGSGKGKRVLIVGEAPAPNGWRKSGKAFYTTDGKLLPTGRNLNKLLKPYGLTVDECSFTELVKCFVGNNRKLLKECGTKCWPIFLKQIQNRKFNLLLLLGKETLNIFNNNGGFKLNIGEISFIILNGKSCTVLPIFHPSPIGPYNHINNLAIFGGLKEELKRIL